MNFEKQGTEFITKIRKRGKYSLTVPIPKKEAIRKDLKMGQVVKTNIRRRNKDVK